MNIREFISVYDRHPAWNVTGDLLPLQEVKRFLLSQASGSSMAVFAAHVIKQFPSLNHVFILNDEEEALYFHTDISMLHEERDLHFFPDSYRKVFYDAEVDSNKVLRRTETLDALLKHQTSNLVVTYHAAIAEKVVDEGTLKKNTFLVQRKDVLDIDFLSEFLNSYNFDHVDFVFQPGQYAVRGGIIDVFSFANEYPYRIELDGEEVDTIREFDPNSQLSIKFLTEINLVPDVESGAVGKKERTIFDHLPSGTIIWTKDWKQACKGLEANYDKAGAALVKDFAPVKQLNDFIRSFTVFEIGASGSFDQQTEIPLNTVPQPSFQKNFDLITAHLKQLIQDGYTIHIFSENGRQIERLFSIFEDIDPLIVFDPVYKGLSGGYCDHTIKLACYTEHQLFDRYYRYKGKRTFSSTKALTIRELKELKQGDYITHMDHGIGRFAGLAKVDQNGTMVEAVRIVYRDNDNLFVHINSLHKISKYVGKEGTEPRLNKLGSDAWDKLKQKTKNQVKDIARDLIKLYAARKASKGFSFSPDSYLQTELEASFIYEDTPDQSKATADVKRDMEAVSPMDRLVCGDVGFGKTEVAIRAAFKAVADSKQVAILVPTTILAYQHYKTFKERLRDMPCKIDYVSRHRTAAEKKKVLASLAEGKIDIIIGTHALTGKEVKFKDLGLMIIDEEQKFGVAAKEKLKQFKVSVDTLTLTATPIPRTLHFSLMGARDLSVINTPPPNRQPVRTELHVFDPKIVKEAIDYEVGRGGQVFFIHNRVKDIADYKLLIENLCPGIQVAVAHGQMKGDELEDIMIKFVEGDYDVLIATTIVESGIDIPNANTIIINNAHMYGLSDLHQMRGRVGRSNKKAYSFLFSPPLSTLTDEAKKRLTAIEQFADLGSGFSVAMRDLDIRGAGNLLGAEQSGFIAEIGFDMYQKILDEAIHELKSEEFAEVFRDEPAQKHVISDCQVESDIEILIPDDYVTNIQERLSLYTELANVKDETDLQAYAGMLKDRFGPMPETVDQLLDSVRLKWMGDLLGLEKIALRGQLLTCYFPSNQLSKYYQGELFGQIIAYVGMHPHQCKMKQTPKALTLAITPVRGLIEAREALEKILAFAGKSQ